MFHRIIFTLLIVRCLSCNFNCCAVYFQSFMKTACRSTQNAARIKRFRRLHIVIKPSNKKIIINIINIINSLLCWSVTLWLFIYLARVKIVENRLAVWVILEIFLTVSLKAYACFHRPEYFNECNLYCKIVKYCILSEVCMIKTASHSTVSPHMWCIKSI